jgi:hypothetical protein
MKRLLMFLLAAMMSLGLARQVKADNLIGPPIAITAGSSHFEAHDDSTPPYKAWVYPNNPDVWTFNFSSFPSPVAITLSVSDNFPSVPDDYNVYWDGVLLGNTQTASPGWTFLFDTAAAAHTLTVEYVNQNTGLTPSPGGSYYNLVLDATPVPLPSTLLLLGPALVGLWGLRRSFPQ